MILYLTDNAGIYIGETFTAADPLKPLPRGVPVEPPALTGTEVAQWVVSQWTVLPERPVPPVLVPQSVTMRQGRLALLGAGLLHTIDAAINAIEDDFQREAARVEWEYAQTIDRNSQFVANMAQQLGLTDEHMDQLFLQASQL